MEMMPHRRQYLGDEADLTHRLSLIHEYVPVEGEIVPADQLIQLVIPEERRVFSFMQEMEAEMKEKVRLAERLGIHIQPPLSHGSRPYRLHGSGADERWVGQSPMRFDYDAMLRVNKLERIGKGFQKPRPMFVTCITELTEELFDG
jgi:hypothetical protein